MQLARSGGGCRRLALSALLLGSGALAPPVRADTAEAVVLLTPSPDERPREWSEVVHALRALGRRSVQVAELGVDPVFAACRALACGRQLAQLANKPVLLVTFTGSDANADALVRLQLLTARGQQIELQRAWAGSTRSAALAQLFESATEQLSLGDKAKLRIATVPIGAVVWLDGEPIGVTPLERNVAVGAHELRVSLSGHVPAERHLALARGEVQSIELQMLRDLGVAEASAPGSAPSPKRTASPVNFLLGGALSLAALPLLVSGTNALANDGQCLDRAADGCRTRARFGARSAVQLVVGAAALLAGGYFVAWQPFQLDSEIAPDRAELRLSGRF